LCKTFWQPRDGIEGVLALANRKCLRSGSALVRRCDQLFIQRDLCASSRILVERSHVNEPPAAAAAIANN
jgi:hypothetical protein